jgi:hypothetical protein
MADFACCEGRGPSKTAFAELKYFSGMEIVIDGENQL